MLPMNTLSFKPIKVKKLFDWFDRCCLAIPEIQREFEWDAKRSCALLDSIYRGFPIGTIMIWRTHRNNQWLLRHKLHILPQYDPFKNTDIFFLIDGQQRLSVLYKLLEGKPGKNSKGKEVSFDKIYFTLANEDHKFLILKNPDPSLDVKVSHILSNKWRTHLKGFPNYKRAKIVECRKKLLTYELPIIFTTANNQADIREIFIRINAQGMKITEADKAFSLAMKVKPLHRYDAIRKMLPFGYSAMSKEVYWNTFVLAHGSPDIGKVESDHLARKIAKDENGILWFDRNAQKIEDSIRLACDYLINQFKVIDFKLLPYKNMIAMLAAFFYWNNRSQPNKKQKDQIKSWFWHTAVLSRYTGRSYHRSIPSDAKFFYKLGANRTGKYQATEKLPFDSLRLTEYRKGNALSSAFQLLLINKRPRYITNGERIPLGPVASSLNEPDLHHIFPKKQLIDVGLSPKKYNNLGNMCYLVAHDNRSFGSKLPNRYLLEFRRKQHFARTMKSLLIPYESNSPLWDTKAKIAFGNFVNKRLKLLINEFKEVSGIKLFE